VAALYERGAAVPCERQAVLAGGMRGADKDGALARAGITRSGYLTVSVDVILAEMARRSLIPVARGLSPLEDTDLVHAEAQHVAKGLATRAIAGGRNLLLDVTMASQPSVQSWLVNLGLAMYAMQVVLARPAARTPCGGWTPSTGAASRSTSLAGIPAMCQFPSASW
jgi:hypothetical protein